ncbi:MAG: stalk domain-containing protein [Symbiobacteriia bacterium]
MHGSLLRRCIATSLFTPPGQAWPDRSRQPAGSGSRLLGSLLLAVLVLPFAAVTAVAGTTAPATAVAAAIPSVTILLDGYNLPFDSEPFIENGRTMVPFRTISEALGVTVGYDGATLRVTGDGLGHSVALTLGSRAAQVDGQAVTLDVAPHIVGARTMVPLRFFSESFGAQVGWADATRTVTVLSPPRRLEALGFYAIHSFAERSYVSRFDSMAYGWAHLTGDSLVDTTSTEYSWPDPAGDVTGNSLLADAKAAGTQRYLMVWAVDGQGDVSRVLADDQRISLAASAMARVAREHGFDGVVLDLEGLGLTGTAADVAQVQQRFTRLVTATTQALASQGGKLIVAVPPPNGAYRGYDLKAIASAADRVMLMSYEYTTQGPEPMDRVDQGLQQALALVPREKLLLGISAASETADTLRPKVGLAKRYSLAGVAIWRLGIMGDAFLQSLRDQIIMN